MSSKHTTTKKRHKKYRGANARLNRPHVIRVEAEERSLLREWWLGHGQMVKIGVITGGIILFIVLLVVGIAGLF